MDISQQQQQQQNGMQNPEQQQVENHQEQKPAQTGSKNTGRQGNQKNTYIKKINTLIEKVNPMQEGISQLPPEIDQSTNKGKRQKNTQQGEINEDDKDKQKLARNRESARNSRKRKKIYLELLENKVTQLSDFLGESTLINKNSEELLANLQSQIIYKNELTNQKQILFRNMQMALASNTSENNINGIIDSLKKKFGTVSSERMLVLDYCYKQIAEQMLPIHQQYILYASKYKQDIFEDQPSNNQQKQNGNNEEEENQEEGFHNIIKSLKFNEKQTLKCKKLQKSLNKEKTKMDQLLGQLYETKELMKEELQSLDKTFEELRKEFNPTLIGKFLMEIEKFQQNKNMKQSFNKFFSDKPSHDYKNLMDKSDEEDEDDQESEGDLYDFIKSENSCNNLMVDINQAYDVYVDAYDFLSKKQSMQKEDKQQQQQQAQQQQQPVNGNNNNNQQSQQQQQQQIQQQQ